MAGPRPSRVSGRLLLLSSLVEKSIGGVLSGGRGISLHRRLRGGRGRVLVPGEKTRQLQIVQPNGLQSVQIESKSVLLLAALALFILFFGTFLFWRLCGGLVLHAVAARHHWIASLFHH